MRITSLIGLVLLAATRRFRSLVGLFALLLLALVPILTSAVGPPDLSLSHRFVSLTRGTDGLTGLEYDFTITNNGATDFCDLRFALGIGAPEPVGSDGQPTLRMASLGAGERVTVRYTLTTLGPVPEALARATELVGWVEAVEAPAGDIVRSGVVSLWAEN